MPFLVGLCIIAIVPGNQNEASESWVREFPVAAFAAFYQAKAGRFEIRH